VARYPCTEKKVSVAAQALEQSVLESKDKEQLLAIAKALGVKATARSKKADIIDQILESTGAGREPTAADAPAAPAVSVAPAEANGGVTAGRPDEGDAPASRDDGGATGSAAAAVVRRSTDAPASTRDTTVGTTAPAPDREPPAEWELLAGEDGVTPTAAAGTPTARAGTPTTSPQRDDRRETAGRIGPVDGARTEQRPANGTGGGGFDRDDEVDGDGDGDSRSSRRRRRRRKGKGGQDGPQGDDRGADDRPVDRGVERAGERGGDERDDREELDDRAPASLGDTVEVDGYLDMRDEGYGFLRVKGYLPSRDDAYVPVKLARQYGLRRGDRVTGTCRPAGRNEKNPALLEVTSVNGLEPEAARSRPRFEDLTALFPDQRLRLEDPSDPANMTARIIDLVAPIGKGQRGLIVSPPKAGKTTIMKTIATAIEKHNPEVKLMVLLIDERPEEVTDMRRTVKGEVISSTFDRPSDEHTHVAELAIEKAKRMVEQGEDVVVILDGITRLSRAYNLAAPPSGRILSGGIDAGALYPPKKFFGAARNTEEGGSLTILATALVETNSRMDEAIFEEFKGTGNMELRLDRRLAERRVYPAIDVDASSTRHEELLFDRKQLQQVWKLRRVLSGLAAEGNAAPGLELLMDRLKTFRSNDEFLNEIART
jgi:transcription termination factor Rho